MKNSALSLFLCFLFFSISCQSSKEKEIIESQISELKETLAPDKRVAIWDISYENGKLLGTTDQVEGYEQMLETIKEMGYQVDDEVVRLPSEELGDQIRALVTISVANIRSQPKHSAELATQALMGTPLKVLEKSDGWYRVQTPDQYISWVDASGIQLMTEEELESWYRTAKVVFTDFSGFVMDSNERVSDLVAGDIMELESESQEFFQVKLPDGRSGQIKKSEAMPWEQWIASRDTEPQSLISTAKTMMGAPYLWGGTSIKGVDCSGFTKTIFYLNGKIIPRDASQQVLEGEQVDVDKNWENLEVGDLLFFGKKATEDSKERVVHVGMWIGNNQFIHSRGRVRISSFDPESPLYDEYELNRYLRTKRILNTPSENILSVSSLLEL
ncbi:C40 family peptidase [Algoriphagus sediminis]|uniref:C40 family peptidase n=1 Tax=Algoriphagus sediminis TaxID=3057113 RepID=A0ABT7YDG2_9BACT|nr:C40 family peptidase [Algoriphagus sediminis]MDN3204559.1 C40 family peptidase [Algoriphagus sediminis]